MSRKKRGLFQDRLKLLFREQEDRLKPNTLHRRQDVVKYGIAVNG